VNQEPYMSLIMRGIPWYLFSTDIYPAEASLDRVDVQMSHPQIVASVRHG